MLNLVILALMAAAFLSLAAAVVFLYRFMARKRLFPQLPRLWKSDRLRFVISLVSFLVLAAAFATLSAMAPAPSVKETALQAKKPGDAPLGPSFDGQPPPPLPAKPKPPRAKDAGEERVLPPSGPAAKAEPLPGQPPQPAAPAALPAPQPKPDPATDQASQKPAEQKTAQAEKAQPQAPPAAAPEAPAAAPAPPAERQAAAPRCPKTARRQTRAQTGAGGKTGPAKGPGAVQTQARGSAQAPTRTGVPGKSGRHSNRPDHGPGRARAQARARARA